MEGFFQNHNTQNMLEAFPEITSSGEKMQSRMLQNIEGDDFPLDLLTMSSWKSQKTNKMKKDDEIMLPENENFDGDIHHFFSALKERPGQMKEKNQKKVKITRAALLSFIAVAFLIVFASTLKYYQDCILPQGQSTSSSRRLGENETDCVEKGNYLGSLLEQERFAESEKHTKNLLGTEKKGGRNSILNWRNAAILAAVIGTVAFGSGLTYYNMKGDSGNSTTQLQHSKRSIETMDTSILNNQTRESEVEKIRGKRNAEYNGPPTVKEGILGGYRYYFGRITKGDLLGKIEIEGKSYPKLTATKWTGREKKLSEGPTVMGQGKTYREVFFQRNDNMNGAGYNFFQEQFDLIIPKYSKTDVRFEEFDRGLYRKNIKVVYKVINPDRVIVQNDDYSNIEKTQYVFEKAGRHITRNGVKYTILSKPSESKQFVGVVLGKNFYPLYQNLY